MRRRTFRGPHQFMRSPNMSKTMVEKKKSCAPHMMDVSACMQLDIAQCELRMEECKGGCKIYCICEDELACVTMQDLCRKMLECPCSISCTKDGVVVCRCDFDCCDCRCEM